MTSRLVALCFDANDPLRLARFWAAALRWKVDDDTHDAIGVVPTDDTRFRLVFLPVLEHNVGHNRLHFDPTSTSIDDQQESVARLVGLGARHIDIGQSPHEGHVVLDDPEGNEFCIIEPENNFLAGCGRLGSITCDGTQQVGYFWSATLGWPLAGITTKRPRSGRRTAAVHSSRGAVRRSPRRSAKNRLHLNIAPTDHGDQRAPT